MTQTAEPIAAALHRKFVLTPWSAQRDLSPPSIERGEGVFLYDDAGRRREIRRAERERRKSNAR